MENKNNNNCQYCGQHFQGEQAGQNYCSPFCKETMQNEKLLRDIFAQNGQDQEQKREVPTGLGRIAGAIASEHFLKALNRLKRIEDFWTFCHATFWFDRNFCEEEQNHYRRLIGTYFDNQQDADSVFTELVERACALKLYFNRNRDTKIPSPSEWLNGNRYCNLRCSKMWHHDFLHKLSPNAASILAVKWLAKSYQRFAQSSNLLEVALFRQTLISNKQPELLQIYLNAVFHFQFVQF
ncbi:MAG: hypothetical protein IT236_03605 [Bacteroidia bacterium]|nr:hypothetical protein [Bacteroidia bacterium]